jgi:hypothetical protein
LFSQKPGLIRDYDGKWVAVLDGEVVSTAGDLDGLLQVMAESDVDPRLSLIRYIRANQRTLIL